MSSDREWSSKVREYAEDKYSEERDLYIAELVTSGVLHESEDGYISSNDKKYDWNWTVEGKTDFHSRFRDEFDFPRIVEKVQEYKLGKGFNKGDFFDPEYFMTKWRKEFLKPTWDKLDKEGLLDDEYKEDGGINWNNFKCENLEGYDRDMQLWLKFEYDNLKSQKNDFEYVKEMGEVNGNPIMVNTETKLTDEEFNQKIEEETDNYINKQMLYKLIHETGYISFEEMKDHEEKQKKAVVKMGVKDPRKNRKLDSSDNDSLGIQAKMQQGVRDSRVPFQEIPKMKYKKYFEGFEEYECLKFGPSDVKKPEKGGKRRRKTRRNKRKTSKKSRKTRTKKRTRKNGKKSRKNRR